MFNRKVNPVCYTRGLKVMQKKKMESGVPTVIS